MQEILGPNDTVRFVGRAHPLKADISDLTMPAGLSVAEMLDIAIPDQGARRYVNVYIGGELIAPEWHARLRPKVGTRVEFRAWVQGDDIFRSVLMIAVLLTASWAGGAALAAGTSLFGLTATATAGLITAGVNIAGMLIVNAIAPPATQGQDALGSAARQVSLPGIRGSRNRAAPYEAIPLVLGRHLVVPLLGAEHFTENSGDDQYLRSLFVVGFGPLNITDIKIGDTPIDEYEEVEIEVREGHASDAPISLYPGQVYQEDLAVELWYADGWHVRTTAPDIHEAIVDTVAPNGVGLLRKDGDWEKFRIKFRVMWRAVGATAWHDGGEFEYHERKPRTRRRSRRIKFPSRGQYEIRLRRATGDAEASPANEGVYSAFNETVIWSALRSIRNDNPIQTSTPLALIALRIKATDQLNGVIDDLSCVATSVVDDWNGATWVQRESRNPASLYRHLLRGPHLKRQIAAARLDLPALQQWHDANRIEGRRCDAVIMGQRTLFDALRDVAATGRGAFLMKDGLYSVKRDVEQTVPVQMITPRNIISMSAERVFPDLPDALRVSFVSAAAGYQADEIVVYADGMNRATAQTYDALDLWGVTEADAAVKDARYNMAVVQLRPERLTIRMDMEHLVARPGDMVRVAHDVMLVGLAQGRVVDREMVAGACVSITVDEDCQMEAGKDYRVVVRRASAANPEMSEFVAPLAGIGSAAIGSTFRVSGQSDQRTLTFRTPVEAGDLPAVGDLFAFGEHGRVTEEWVVNGIEPDESLEATLTLVPHAPAVHTADRKPIPDYKPKITIPIEMRRPRPPVILNIETGDAALDKTPEGVSPRIIVSVRIRDGSGEPAIARLEALVRDAGDRRWDIDGLVVQGFHQVIVRDVREGQRYDLRFRVISEFGHPSRWVEASGVEVIGAAERPLPPEELHLDIIRGTALLSWEPSPSIDVAGYIVKHSRSISGATWANAIFIERVGRQRTSMHLPLQVGTYMVKSIDQRGRRSLNAAAVVTSVPRVLRENFVLDIDGHPGWAGTKTNVMVDGTLGGIRLVETPEVQMIAETQTGINVEVQTGVPMVVQAIPAVVEATGDWESPTPIDLGAAFTARVRAKLQIGAVVLGTDMFAWPDFFGVEDVFGGVDDAVTVRAYVATTNDNPASSPTWSEWKRLQGAGDFTARAFKFKLRLISTATAATPVVEEATFVVDMDDRVWSTEVTLAAGGTAVSFVPSFYVRPTVGITIQDGANGDRPKITGLTRSGMTVQVLNAAGSGVSRSVEIIAKAYGDEGT